MGPSFPPGPFGKVPSIRVPARECPHGTFEVEATERQLLEVVCTLGTPRRLAGRLHGRQQERNEDADDGDHHQQFDQRKTVQGPVDIPSHEFTLAGQV